MDFRTPHQIGDEIEADFEQLKITGGYDHNYVTDYITKPVSVRLPVHGPKRPESR